MEPFNAIANVILGFRNGNSLQRWARLLFSMSASYTLGMSTVTGAALVAHLPTAIAVGYGLMTGSAMALVAYLQSDKKSIEGTVIAVPQRTVNDQFDTSTGQGPMVSK